MRVQCEFLSQRDAIPCHPETYQKVVVV